MQPIGNKVLIIPDEVQKQTKGGLHIPDSQRDQPRTGVVYKSGKGDYAKETGVFMPNEVQDGDSVVYSWLNAVPIELDGKNLILIDAAYIFLRQPKN